MAEDWARPLVFWEIQARDPEMMRTFYTKMFNWDISEGPRMTIAAGVGPPEPGPAGQIRQADTSRIGLYIQVLDLRESLDRAETLGGKITLEPRHNAGRASIAAITDPEGNAISLVQQ